MTLNHLSFFMYLFSKTIIEYTYPHTYIFYNDFFQYMEGLYSKTGACPSVIDSMVQHRP